MDTAFTSYAIIEPEPMVPVDYRPETINTIHLRATQGMPCDQPHGHLPRCAHRADCSRAGYTCTAFRAWQALKPMDLSRRTPDD